MFNSGRFIILFSILFVLLVNGFAAAEVASVAAKTDAQEKIEIIIASGIGIDADSARINAIRNAIEQVVGSYITSETMVKNNELISDKILSYSGGYVKESKVLSQGKTPDGLFMVKIETQVVATRLKLKLQELNIAIKKVDGGSLFGEAVSKSQQKTDGKKLLYEVIYDKFPQSAYIIYDIGKPEIVSTDEAKGTTKLKIAYSIKFDDKYLEQLKTVLSQIATKEVPDPYISELLAEIKNKSIPVCYSQIPLIKSGIAETCWILKKDIFKENRECFWNPIGEIKIDIRFKNTTGKILDTAIVGFNNKNFNNNLINITYKSPYSVSNDYHYPMFYCINGRNSEDSYTKLPLFVTDATYSDVATVDISTANLSVIDSVVLKLK